MLLRRVYESAVSGQFGAIALSKPALQMETFAMNADLEQAGNLFTELKAAQEGIARVMMLCPGDK